jgi:hypothetical protein
MRTIFPEFDKIYSERNWKILPHIGRVYVNEKARMYLGKKPKYNLNIF